VVIVGFFVAAVCGYMAGLIGSSNSPVSGLAILAVLGVSLILAFFAREAAPAAAPAFVAYALFVTAIVLNVATISNDNLQDLKTGQLVGATPWKQQVALVVGVIFGAVVIPPVLVVLNKAYGFNGGPHALGAPQATLISTLAKGVIGGAVDWNLIFVGAVVGAVVIAIDEIGRRTGRFRFPPLAVGLGIYLPAGTTAPAVIGAIFGALYNRWVSRHKHPQSAKRLGVLVASGLITGESLFGVALAGIIYVSNNPTPLQIVPDSFAGIANALGGIALFVVPFLVYRWIGLRAQKL
jgi:putative OPT family oligopeptide transporter